MSVTDCQQTLVRARTRAIPQTPYAMNEAVLTDRKMWLIKFNFK